MMTKLSRGQIASTVVVDVDHNRLQIACGCFDCTCSLTTIDTNGRRFIGAGNLHSKS